MTQKENRVSALQEGMQDREVNKDDGMIRMYVPIFSHVIQQNMETTWEEEMEIQSGSIHTYSGTKPTEFWR